MKLTAIRNRENLSIVYTLTISERDLTSIIFTDHDKQLIKKGQKSDKISDKILTLEIIARKIEKEK